MPEPNPAAPPPLPMSVLVEEFETKVPEHFRGQYVDDADGKKKRFVADYGDDNPGALRNALARQKAERDKFKADLDKYLPLGAPEEVADLVAKAKAPPPPSDGKIDDAALKAAQEAHQAKERAWRLREAELATAQTALETRLREGHQDNEIANAISQSRPKPDSVVLLTDMLKAESRIEEEDGKLKVRVVEKKDGELKTKWNGQGKEMTLLERLEELRAKPSWANLFEPSPANGTGAAPGRSSAAPTKTMTRSQFEALPALKRSEFLKGEGRVVDG